MRSAATTVLHSFQQEKSAISYLVLQDVRFLRYFVSVYTYHNSLFFIAKIFLYTENVRKYFARIYQ